MVVQWASPAPGFTVDIEHGFEEVDVEFESESHKSKIDAKWSAEGPIYAIKEEGDS